MGTGTRLVGAGGRARAAVLLARSPLAGMEEVYRRFGPVFPLRLGPLRYVYLLGPEANRFVFAHSDLFRWREAFEALVPVDGETALIVSDGEDHRRRRRLVAPAFGPRAVGGYARTMARNADAAIGSWRPGQEVDLYQEFRRVIRRSTIEVLFGDRLAADEAEIGTLLQTVLDVVSESPLRQRLGRLGLPSWRRAMAARAAVERRVRAEIEHRRRHPGGGDEPDVLSALVASRDAESGGGLTDTEIVDQVISLIAAGYETTSAAMAWTLGALLGDDELWRQAAADSAARSAGAGRDRDWSYLDGVVAEALRLHPPAAISARMAAERFEFAGNHVEAGSTLIFSPYVTHRLPELWPDPLRFDPLRWDPRRPGHHRPAPHEFLPFGGGPHRCLGAAFATLELTVLLERVVRRTRLRIVAFDPAPVTLAAMRPRRGPIATVQSVEPSDPTA